MGYRVGRDVWPRSASTAATSVVRRSLQSNIKICGLIPETEQVFFLIFMKFGMIIVCIVVRMYCCVCLVCIVVILCVLLPVCIVVFVLCVLLQLSCVYCCPCILL